ncbi:MAG: YesL family protein [Clostridiales bacterium]|nr:YesL family protein [Clostridiales bacterium]
MNFLKMDSPVMRFIGIIADLIILNLLAVICSIPIITAGTAYTAKYAVAMKIIRGEETAVFVPYFKAFKRNFKSATIVWLILLMAIILIVLDWRWIILSGWASTAFFYKLGVIVMSVAVWMVTVCIIGLISRYEMKIIEYFKAAITMALIKIIPLALITALIIGSVVACLWYSRWFPAVYAFTTTAITYFLSRVFIKQFDKLEKGQKMLAELEKENEESSDEEDDDEIEDESIEEASEETEDDNSEAIAAAVEVSADNKSYAQSVKQLHKEMENDNDREPEEEIKGNKLTKFLRTEKRKLKDLTFKQKVGYFFQYYFAGLVLVILFIIGVSWFGHDVYKGFQKVITGGLINCKVTDEGRKYATEDFLDWAGYNKTIKKAVLSDTDLSFNTEMEFEEQYLDIAFRVQMATGEYSYVIMREDAVDNYVAEDFFQDIDALTDISRFDEADLYMGPNNTAVAIKLNDRAIEKLGLQEGSDYYIAFAYNTTKTKPQTQFIDYLFMEE